MVSEPRLPADVEFIHALENQTAAARTALVAFVPNFVATALANIVLPIPEGPLMRVCGNDSPSLNEPSSWHRNTPTVRLWPVNP